MKSGRRSVVGYSYPEFCAAVEELHGRACWVRKVLQARVDAGVQLPPGLLRCAGAMDGHHLLPKQLLKREFPHGVFLKTSPGFAPQADSIRLPGHVRTVERIVPGGVAREQTMSLAGLLNDGRIGVPVDRRHHDMVEAKLIRIARVELPPEVEEAAAELGLGWFLDREFGDEPAS